MTEARDRALLTADLLTAGEEMMRLVLQRRHPVESAVEIEHRLNAWFSERPGAEFGDAGPEPYFRRRQLRSDP